MNILITGASKGIGLELCRIALQNGNQVCAIARTATKSEGLKKLTSDFNQKLKLVDLDVTTSEATKNIVASIEQWPSLDVLINNAGVLEKVDTEESLIHSFRMNSIAPYLLTSALLPKLKHSKKPIVTQITSRMGSIEDTSSGGYCGYRASKAALNMFNKCLAVENPWLTAIVVHPGWVKTAMGGDAAPVEPIISANGIWKVIEEANKNSSSGKFFDYQGKILPW
jgi:NAD(P)-dependent dehydrogenase (short-subunit alcohol dehydrogenase family)